VDRLLARGQADEAALLADSLYFAWRTRSGIADRAAEALWREAGVLGRQGRRHSAADRLRELLERYPESRERREAVRLLARLDVELVRDPSTARLLLSHPDAVDDSARAVLRTAAGNMSALELSAVLAGASSDGPPSSRAAGAGRPRDRAVLMAALARDLARSGRADSATRVASSVLEGTADGAEREVARAVASGGIRPRTEPLVIGAILTTSGRFAQVGAWLREGIDLALEEADSGRGPSVRIETQDEGDDPSVVPRLVRSLEEQGAVAIIGPVRSRALSDAAAARRDPGLLLLSPTATEALPRSLDATYPGAYALWDRARRRVDAARDLGRWLGHEVGLGPSATLYAADGSGVDEALAYRAGLGSGSGTIASEPFDPDSTTFRGPIARVGAFEPRGVFVAGGDPSTVLQLAPQLSYYGTGDVLVAGGVTWSRPEVVRRLEPSPTQERIVATYLDWSDPHSGWESFRARYEKKYHKSLGNNVVPALGYDAAKLVLAALRGESVPHPRATSRAFARLSGLQGATGVLSPDVSRGSVARATLIRRLSDRRLVPAEPDSVRAWLDRSGFLAAAGLRRQRAVAREAVRKASADSTGGSRP
jgi:ABC-type branched-subunit amino acid transport system substrate-binding protein